MLRRGKTTVASRSFRRGMAALAAALAGGFLWAWTWAGGPGVAWTGLGAALAWSAAAGCLAWVLVALCRGEAEAGGRGPETGPAEASPAAASDSDASAADRWLAEADRHAAAGRWEAALAAYRRCLAARPEDAVAGLAEARCLAALDRSGEAVAAYSRWIDRFVPLAAGPSVSREQAQDAASAHHARGLLLAAAGRLDEAAEDLDRAVMFRAAAGADPQAMAQDWARRGLVRAAAGRWEEAEADFRQASETMEAERRAGRTAPAAAAAAIDRWASSLAALGRLDEAATACGRVLELLEAAPEEPGEPGARLLRASAARRRGVVRAATGRWEAAVADLEEAVRLWRELADQPHELAETLYQRAAARAAQGDLAGAEADFREAAELQEAAWRSDPSPERSAELGATLAAWSRVLSQQAAAGRPDRTALALELANRACQLSGEQDHRAWEALGLAQAAAGRWEEAVRSQRRAVEAAPPGSRETAVQRLEVIAAAAGAGASDPR